MASVEVKLDRGNTLEAHIMEHSAKPNAVPAASEEERPSQPEGEQRSKLDRWADMGRAICFAINRRQLEREGFDLGNHPG